MRNHQRQPLDAGSSTQPVEPPAPAPAPASSSSPVPAAPASAPAAASPPGGSTVCDLCEEETASIRCDECDQHFCADCDEGIHVGKSKDHVRKPLGAAPAAQADESKQKQAQEEEQRKRAEKEQAEAEERQRQAKEAEEEKRRRELEEEEARRRKSEQEARRLQEEEEAEKKRKEEERKRSEAEAEQKRAAEEERVRKEKEAAELREAEEKKQKEEARRADELKQKQREEEEVRRRAEEQKQREEEEARRRAEEQKQREEEEEARRKAAEEKRLREEREAELRKQREAEEAERRRVQELLAAERRRKEEEAQRLRKEAEERGEQEARERFARRVSYLARGDFGSAVDEGPRTPPGRPRTSLLVGASMSEGMPYGRASSAGPAPLSAQPAVRRFPPTVDIGTEEEGEPEEEDGGTRATARPAPSRPAGSSPWAEPDAPDSPISLQLEIRRLQQQQELLKGELDVLRAERELLASKPLFSPRGTMEDGLARTAYSLAQQLKETQETTRQLKEELTQLRAQQYQQQRPHTAETGPRFRMVPDATGTRAAQLETIESAVDRARVLFEQFQRESALLQRQLAEAQEAKQAIEAELKRVAQQKSNLASVMEDELKRLNGNGGPPGYSRPHPPPRPRLPSQPFLPGYALPTDSYIPYFTGPYPHAPISPPPHLMPRPAISPRLGAPSPSPPPPHTLLPGLYVSPPPPALPPYGYARHAWTESLPSHALARTSRPASAARATARQGQAQGQGQRLPYGHSSGYGAAHVTGRAKTPTPPSHRAHPPSRARPASAAATTSRSARTQARAAAAFFRPDGPYFG